MTHVLWRGSSLQRVRIVSGLILFAFATAHFLNHALGLISVDAMVAFDGWRTAITRSLPGTIVLCAALLAHASLALWKLVGRRTLRLPAWELWQIGLGLAIPFFLLPHIVNTRITAVLFGVDTTYPYELLRIWPATIIDQTALLLLVWLHGCLGLHFWLRLTPGYRRAAPALLALATLLPFAALTGVMMEGRILGAEMAADPARFAALKAATHWPGAAATARIVDLRVQAREVFYAAVAVVVLLLAARMLLARRSKRIPVQYVAGPLVRTDKGPTLLEISRMHGIPHLSACGGRGRCSTCRVLVLSGETGLQPPSETETRTLKAIGAADNIRLACQARPTADMTVMRLLNVKSPAALLATGDYASVERDLAVLFIDIRGFTSMTESKLAFDVVFILNQFFAAVGRPIYNMGGYIDDYAGDGLMALFADPRGVADACRAAVLAAAEVDRAIEALNARLSDELPEPLRVAMGLHAGAHVVGRIGFGDSQQTSVIGLAVNVASRLESLAKVRNAQLALSEEVARHAGLDTRGLLIDSVDIRGLSKPVGVLLIDSARGLVERLRSAEFQAAG